MWLRTGLRKRSQLSVKTECLGEMVRLVAGVVLRAAKFGLYMGR